MISAVRSYLKQELHPNNYANKTFLVVFGLDYIPSWPPQFPIVQSRRTEAKAIDNILP